MRSLVANAILGALLILSTGAAGQDFPTPPPDHISPPPPGSSIALDRQWSPSSLDNTVSLLGLLSYRYPNIGFGVGGYYQKTIARRGVLRHAGSIHDEFGVEGGFEFRHHEWDPESSYTEFAFSVGAVWNIWFAQRFAAYPKLGLGYGFGTLSTPAGIRSRDYGGLFGLGAVGAVYQVDGLVFRAEIGNLAIAVGLGFSFQ